MSTLLIMAGGTGGHVYPALAVAEDLRGRGVNVVWLGTRRGLEARAVPAAGFDIEWITVEGIKGSRWVNLLRAPILIAIAMVQTVAVLLRRRPAALLGMGGFASGPGGMTAWLLRRPLIIHEANAVAGFTNRVLARLATRVLTGFPDTFPGATCVGNPVRSEIADLPEPRQRAQDRSGPLRLLVVGGSQGARALNEFVPQCLASLPFSARPQVRHQTGPGNDVTVRAAYQSAGIDAEVEPFIDDMAATYAWADLVLCRAGAMTVAEIAAAGLAAVFVPFPHATDDHQTYNARYLADRGAAFVLSQSELTVEKFAGLLATDREHLTEMAVHARTLARTGATRAVADTCLEYLRA